VDLFEGSDFEGALEILEVKDRDWMWIDTELVYYLGLLYCCGQVYPNRQLVRSFER